jgi:hypothetical protein
MNKTILFFRFKAGFSARMLPLFLLLPTATAEAVAPFENHTGIQNEYIDTEFSHEKNSIQISQQYRCNPNPEQAVVPGEPAGQVGDPAFCPQINEPAYSFDKGPVVLFDEGHSNWATISPHPTSPVVGRYFAFGELLKADGYVVKINKGVISKQTLEGVDILVIVHPLPAEYLTFYASVNRYGFNPKAFEEVEVFSNTEVQAISNWIASGGALLLNAEHVPFIYPIQTLLAALGLSMWKNTVGGFPIQQYFIKAAPDHPIFKGRYNEENVDKVPFVGGGANIEILDSIATGEVLFKYPFPTLGMESTAEAYLASGLAAICDELYPPPRSWTKAPECQPIWNTYQSGTKWLNAAGHQPAVALEHGLGRVVVFSEFSTFTTQVYEENGEMLRGYGGLPIGEEPLKTGGGILPESDRERVQQLVLNVMRWLAFLIP